MASFSPFVELLAEIEDPRRAEGKLYRLPQVCCSQFWRSSLAPTLPDGQAKAGSNDDLSRSLLCRRMLIFGWRIGCMC